MPAICRGLLPAQSARPIQGTWAVPLPCSLQPAVSPREVRVVLCQTRSLQLWEPHPTSVGATWGGSCQVMGSGLLGRMPAEVGHPLGLAAPRPSPSNPGPQGHWGRGRGRCGKGGKERAQGHQQSREPLTGSPESCPGGPQRLLIHNDSEQNANSWPSRCHVLGAAPSS